MRQADDRIGAFLTHFRYKFPCGFAKIGNFQIVRLAAAARHLQCRHIGRRKQEFLDLSLRLFRLLCQRVKLRRDFLQRNVYLRLGFIHADALAHQSPDFLRRAFALGQQVLAVDVRLFAPRIQRGEMLYVEVKAATGELVGGLTLCNVRRGVTQSCTLGYWVGANYAQQGYMTAAVRAVVPFVFDSLELHRLEAACLPTNTASMRLLEKTGFQLVASGLTWCLEHPEESAEQGYELADVQKLFLSLS